MALPWLVEDGGGCDYERLCFGVGVMLCCVQVQVCAVQSFSVGPTQMSQSPYTYPAQANPT